jgi:hypothetical protein
VSRVVDAGIAGSIIIMTVVLVISDILGLKLNSPEERQGRLMLVLIPFIIWIWLDINRGRRVVASLFISVFVCFTSVFFAGKFWTLDEELFWWSLLLCFTVCYARDMPT